MTDHDTLALDIAKVSGGTPEDIAAVLMRCEAEVRRRQEHLKAVKQAMVDHILATGVPIVIGDIEYRAGTRKDTRCVSNEEAADAVFAAVNGDVKQFAACLGSTAFLPGACRKALPPEEFFRLFETVEKPVLVEGKPRPQLLEFNTRFQKGNRHDRHDDAATAVG